MIIGVSLPPGGGDRPTETGCKKRGRRVLIVMGYAARDGLINIGFKSEEVTM